MVPYSYNINKIPDPISIDSKWDKSTWKNIDSLAISSDNGWGPSYKPRTEAKLSYDDENLYVIFRVEDRFLKCVTKKHNGLVWRDSCVEFFFLPNLFGPPHYFNLEVNCAGFVYMAFQRVPRIDFDLISVRDIESIEIAHSHKDPVKKEIEHSIKWTVEYRLPFQLLKKYADINIPTKGVAWKANFYKCAENNSHPHWLSWNEIDHPEPNFHLPEYFGTLRFK